MRRAERTHLGRRMVLEEDKHARDVVFGLAPERLADERAADVVGIALRRVDPVHGELDGVLVLDDVVEAVGREHDKRVVGRHVALHVVGLRHDHVGVLGVADRARHAERAVDAPRAKPDHRAAVGLNARLFVLPRRRVRLAELETARAVAERRLRVAAPVRVELAAAQRQRHGRRAVFEAEARRVHRPLGVGLLVGLFDGRAEVARKERVSRHVGVQVRARVLGRKTSK
eukprot:TRINITY_DN266_c0_g1_i1.p1 TRINITY_DN266_c0_g1~~TRINITY_DN266_c0_g1_i1.p1  ORF type:complete len:229 (+),score=109.61 TRINITY_DN266_c0_g1_i1:125-811(+)